VGQGWGHTCYHALAAAILHSGGAHIIFATWLWMQLQVAGSAMLCMTLPAEKGSDDSHAVVGVVCADDSAGICTAAAATSLMYCRRQPRCSSKGLM
jgi:hypothetical protein